MRTNIIESLKAVSNYLADEESNFWENCECSDTIHDTGDISKCKCETNRRHIIRDVHAIDKFISGLTPRTENIMRQIEVERNI